MYTLEGISNDRSKAVVPVLVLIFVVLWFILRVDLFYVFPCVILFLCFSVLLVLQLPRLGKRELILVLFVRLFGLCLFRFVGFLFLLGSGKGCGLWLWHSLDFSLTLFYYCLWRVSIKPRLQFLLCSVFFVSKDIFFDVYKYFMVLEAYLRNSHMTWGDTWAHGELWGCTKEDQKRLQAGLSESILDAQAI